MRDKLIELIKSRRDPCDIGACPFTVDDVRPCSLCEAESLAEHLIANGVTFAADNNDGDKKPLTIGERADIARICMGIEQLCRNMAQPGTWEAHTRHMECGEIRELVQRYRDMELVYKALTGHELFVSLKEIET